MIPHPLKLYLESQLSGPITHVQPVGGGDINSAAILSVANRQRYFLKWNSTADPGMMRAEAKGLKELSHCSEVRVPEIICVSPASSDLPAFLLLEELTPGSRTSSREMEFGRVLAALHGVSANAFGYSEDNFIGSLSQRNGWRDSWGEFFFEQRLVVQAQLGEEAGWFTKGLKNLLKEQRSSIVALLNEPQEAPSLLHGDLWGGNVFWSDLGPVLIDPAVYYGSREADLAFTEMFGGFGSAFYESYHEAWPLQPGYERRKKILNLYHLMTHANLFGGHYISSFESSLRSI